MPDAPTIDAKLTDTERAELLASVEGFIRKKVSESTVPKRGRPDLEQECRMAVWRATANFDPDRGNKFISFAAAVVLNVIRREHVHHAERHAAADTCSLEAFGQSGRLLGDPDAADPTLVADAADPVGEAVAEAVAGLARSVAEVAFAPLLDSLTPGHRRLVEMVVLDGLSAAQIAAQLGQPGKAVKRNLQAAVEALAAAGHVPAGLAAAVGLDAAQLARRGDPERAAAERAARRALVAEAGPDVPAGQLAAALGCTPNVIHNDRHVMARTIPAKARDYGKARRAEADTAARLQLVARSPDLTAAELGVALGVNERTVRRDRQAIKRAANAAA